MKEESISEISKEIEASKLPCERLSDKELFDLTDEQYNVLSDYDVATIVERRDAILDLLTDTEKEEMYKKDPDFADGVALLKEMEGMTTEEKYLRVKRATSQSIYQLCQVSRATNTELVEYFQRAHAKQV